MADPKKLTPAQQAGLAVLTGAFKGEGLDFEKPISLAGNLLSFLKGSEKKKTETPSGLPGALPLPDEDGGGGGGYTLSFAQTQAGEAYSADLRFKLAGQRDAIDFARQKQADAADAELLRRQFVQEKELEQKALTQARSELFVNMVGKDIGTAILFALTSGRKG